MCAVSLETQAPFSGTQATGCKCAARPGHVHSRLARENERENERRVSIYILYNTIATCAQVLFSVVFTYIVLKCLSLTLTLILTLTLALTLNLTLTLTHVRPRGRVHEQSKRCTPDIFGRNVRRNRQTSHESQGDTTEGRRSDGVPVTKRTQFLLGRLQASGTNFLSSLTLTLTCPEPEPAYISGVNIPPPPGLTIAS